VSAASEAVLHVAAGCFAIGGGVLLTLGLFTVQVAFLLSGEMAVAYFLSHAPLGWCPLFNGGESSVLYCFAFLLLSVAGGGAWSVDRLAEAGRPQLSTGQVIARQIEILSNGTSREIDNFVSPAAVEQRV
jgi:uncharacterized membrane protein YphA (DoxX/SURF4 family)